MGAPDIAVNGSGSTTVLPGPHRGVVIANTGAYPVYLDHDASVSPSIYDFKILPGQTISWEADRPCYAITDSGFTSALSVSIAVGAFTSPPGVSGAAKTNADLLFSGLASDFPYTVAAGTALNVGAYQSLRWRFWNAGVTVAAPVLAMQWQDKSPAVPGSYSVFDSYKPAPAANSAMEVTQDVVAQYVSLFSLATLFCSDPQLRVELTGYPQRKAPLAFNRYDPSLNQDVNQGRLIQFSEIGGAAGTKTFGLPLWSGLMDVSVTMITNVAATTLPTVSIAPSSNAGSVLQGYGAPFSVLPLNTRDLRSVTVGIPGTRTAMTLRVSAGAGYVTADTFVQVMFYGNEDA